MTTQSELREAIEFMKEQSGSGSKARKQEKFREIYEPAVGHVVTGERYDDAGVGPKRATDAVTHVYDIDPSDYDTISESLVGAWGGDIQSLETLVEDLDELAELSGQDQTDMLAEMLDAHAEPSLVTLALLDDESIGLGTSQMRETFFDGTRDERKKAESFVESTAEFIRLSQEGELPDGPTVGEPFEPMLAVAESRGVPDNPVAQRKLDGYRCILHLDDGEATAFSRRNNDITESLPELQEIEWPEGKYILDGEVIAGNGSYSDTSERIGRKAENVERDVEMHFALFDVIVNSGIDISEKSYGLRHMAVVNFVLDTEDDRIWHVGHTGDIEAAKDDAIRNDEEGIIVKDVQAPYEFGKRSTYWQKQKMDEETVDLTIRGFQEGDGEATGTLGKVELETSDGVYVGNSGSGFTDAQRDEIWNNQDLWLGRTVEIEARGIGSQGKLRMPIFVRDRTHDGEPDSWERVQEIMKDI